MTGNGIKVRPVRNEEDHEAAIERIAELMGSAPGTREGDELEILATLVDAWEEKNEVIDAPDPVAAIQFRMDQEGLTRKDLEPMIGSRARVSEVLSGKRKLTIGMIQRIRERLGISADLLIGGAGTDHRRTRPQLATARRRTGRSGSAGRRLVKDGGRAAR